MKKNDKNQLDKIIESIGKEYPKTKIFPIVKYSKKVLS